MKKISSLTLPLCFLLIPCCYILTWTVTEVYYFKKSTSGIIKKKPTTPTNVIHNDGSKVSAFGRSGKKPSALIFVNISLNNFEQPRFDRTIVDIRKNDFNEQ